MRLTVDSGPEPVDARSNPFGDPWDGAAGETDDGLQGDPGWPLEPGDGTGGDMLSAHQRDAAVRRHLSWLRSTSTQRGPGRPGATA